MIIFILLWVIGIALALNKWYARPKKQVGKVLPFVKPKKVLKKW